MNINLLLVFALFSVVLVESHAVTPEEYWKSVLPNSPMPKAVTNLLYTTEPNEEKAGDQRGTNVGMGRGGIGVQTGRPGRRTNVGIGRGGIGVHTGPNRRPISVGVRPTRNPFAYHYAASEDQLKDNPDVALFFLENDLHRGQEMNLHFMKTDDQEAMFLPREVADSIPFSSKNLPQIYNDFSIKPDSMEAENMKQTLDECKAKGIEGEDKHCATSLESMVDFSTKELGKKVKAISTEVNAKVNTPIQKYKIEVAKKMAAKKVVVCHKQNYVYVYAVFYCHKTISTRAYAVSLAGAYGTKVNAVAVCHTDTAKWNPKHLAFQVLKVKPGSVPICHFLPEDHVVWVPYE